MPDVKMCPFKMAGGFENILCEKGKCMMWRNYSSDCAIGTIADILADSTISQTGYYPTDNEEYDHA